MVASDEVHKRRLVTFAQALEEPCVIVHWHKGTAIAWGKLRASATSSGLLIQRRAGTP